MSTFYETNYNLIENKNQLIEMYRKACRETDASQVGLEVEKLVVSEEGRPLPYQGAERATIRKILHQIRDWEGGEEVKEGENTIALKIKGGMISLEPSGQLEYSLDPQVDLMTVNRYLKYFGEILRRLSEVFGVRYIDLGFHPLLSLEEMEWMPKHRYTIMRNYLPTKGRLPLEMMAQTASLQASFDYYSEEEMARKFRLAQYLNPLLVALFANSPFKEGKFTGFHCYRAHIWEHTDPDRSGFIEKAFYEGFTFADYVEYVLDVPMFFILREEEWIDMAGVSFREFMDKGHGRHQATMGDWALHTTTVFTEVRLRPWLEIRTPDLTNDHLILSFPAFIKGIFYDEEAEKKAFDRLGYPSPKTVQEGREDAARRSLQAQYGSDSIQDLALDLMEISRQGLQSQNCPEDTEYLNRLLPYVKEGKSLASMMLEKCSHPNKVDLSQCINDFEAKFSV